MLDVFDYNKAKYSTCCKFTLKIHACASEIHLQAAKCIVRYMKSTIDFGIKFK